MVKADEIRDEESLQGWVQWRAPHEPVVISQRTVCRVLPLYGRAMRDGWALKNDLTSLPLQRLNLTGVATGLVHQLDRLPSPPPNSAAMKKASNLARDAGEVLLAIIPDVTLGAADIAFGARSDTNYMRGDVARVVDGTARAAEDADGIWAQVREDARLLEADADLLETSLWSTGAPGWFQKADREMRAIWEADPAFIFWLRWWDGVVSGKPLPWSLQERVALISDEIWQQGPEAVAEAIREIEEDNRPSIEPALGQQVAALPAGASADVAKVRRAFSTHRFELPPTFDAVLGLITLEIERLQRLRNYRDEDDADEAKRQIGVLTTLYRSVEGLRALVPETAEMSLSDAEKAEKLSRLFIRKFTEWPRTNADELVDSAYRFGLVGATTAMLPLIGVTKPYALAAGLVLFGSKKMVDAVKIAIDAIKP